MDKGNFRQSIDDSSIPEELLKQREKTAIYKAKQTKRKNIKRLSSLIASGLCLSVLGTGFLSPALAQSLSHIPIIGPIYAQFDDLAAEKIEQNELATVIEKQDTHDGLSMNVKEAVYDGGRLVVTIEYKGDNSKLDLGNEGNQGYRYITINGSEPSVAIGSSTSDDVNSNTIIESHQYTLANYDEYGDSITVAVHGENLFGRKGTWDVSFPLEKVEDKIQTFTPHAKSQTEDRIYTLSVDQVSFLPLSTRIDLTLDYPAEMDENDTWPSFPYVVTDDQGHVYKDLKLQYGHVDASGHKIVLALPPMNTVPKTLTIQPHYDNGDPGTPNYGEILDLKVEVPLN